MGLKDDIATTVESMFATYNGSDMSNTALRRGAVADVTEKIMATVTQHTTAHAADHLTNAVADLADGMRGLLARIDTEVSKDAAKEKENLTKRHADAKERLTEVFADEKFTGEQTDAILNLLARHGWHVMNFGEYYWENG